MERIGIESGRLRIPKSAFGRYLRIGIADWPAPPSDPIEVKFNPWHDTATGRFTFRGGGGGSFGGSGASGSWNGPVHPRSHTSASAKSPSPQPPVSAARAAIAVSKAFGSQTHSVVRNGYTYQLDASDRTTQVTGTLTAAVDPQRSRGAQAGAGGTDRLPTDDGGHYIAARFNGPTDAFNHFAQNANFNRGEYRILENNWANYMREGKQVYVTITPKYAGSSTRPSSIAVESSVSGAYSFRSFPNSSKGKSHGK